MIFFDCRVMLLGSFIATHPAAHYQPRTTPTVPSLGLPMDAADLRRCSLFNLRESVACASCTLVDRIGHHSARRPVL